MTDRNTTRAELSGARAATLAESRRGELVDSALITLSQRGYANTSLRDIAANSPYSHGVMHYYFASKTELIKSCLERILANRRAIVDELLEYDGDPASYPEATARRVVDDIRERGAALILWYDLRAQALFDLELRDLIVNIENHRRDAAYQLLTRYAALLDSQPNVDAETNYARSDGLMHRGLTRHLVGDPDALTWLEQVLADQIRASVA